METVMGLLLLAAAFLLSTGGAKQAALQAGSAGQVVVIDAGHGGSQLRKIKERQPLSLKRLVRFLEKIL